MAHEIAGFSQERIAKAHKKVLTTMDRELDGHSRKDNERELQRSLDDPNDF